MISAVLLIAGTIASAAVVTWRALTARDRSIRARRQAVQTELDKLDVPDTRP